MKLAALIFQIILLTLGFSSNRADALAAAAMFAALTVVVVIISDARRADRPVRRAVR